MILGSPALAQVDDPQICVNQCLYHNGPASNPAYHACVERMCSGDSAEAAPREEPAPSRWRTESVPGAHAAVIDMGGRSLNYMCQRGGPALIGVSGLGGAADGTRISVDGRAFALPFVARNGILYTAADAGSPLVAALMSGSGVEVVSGGRSGTFSLAGSRAAIARTAAACGIRP